MSHQRILQYFLVHVTFVVIPQVERWRNGRSTRGCEHARVEGDRLHEQSWETKCGDLEAKKLMSETSSKQVALRMDFFVKVIWN